MFVRVKKIGNYEYLYLVENAREGGRHVQRVIKALGRRDEVEASGLLDALVASALATLDRAVELLPRRTRGVATGEHWRRFGVWPAVAEHRLSRCYRRIVG
jgi:hypothetical protein